LPPADLLGAVRALPAAGELPFPWEVWALIGLVRHRRRQVWVGEVVTTRLSSSLGWCSSSMKVGGERLVEQQRVLL
jgi:hypothetical protein